MVIEASFTGTVRAILILLALLWVVRRLARARGRAQGPAPRRPVGDVRIEQAGAPPDGRVVDAEYEEVK